MWISLSATRAPGWDWPRWKARSEGGAGGNGGDGAKEVLPGVSVLIIDDEKNIRITTSRILEDRGFRCVSAESGSAGLEYLNSHPREIDIILLDVVMPGMGGEEVGREINRLYPELPILFISGFYRSGDLPEGISGFIKKPFNREELFRAMTSVLNSE